MKLDLRYIVPGPDVGTVLLDADGRMPARLVDGNEDEASVVAATACLREEFAFTTPVLETHPKEEGVPDGEPIPVLVTTGPAPAAWSPPAGLAFGRSATWLDGLPPVLRPRATELLAELRSGAPPPPLRPRWARIGWHLRASAWMTAALAAAGRPLLDEPQPFYLRGISALLRGRTESGDVFLKAVFPPFHAEPAVTGLLAARFPESVPRVLAIDAEEGWLILEDVAAPWIGALSGPAKNAGLAAGARALVAMQRVLARGGMEPFVAAGCPGRSLDDLAFELDAALGPDGVAHVEGAVSDERRRRAVAATRVAVEHVVRLGFPTTVVHGDFHAGNVALVDRRAVIIDWSDAAIGNPLIDLVTWLSWSRDKPDQERIATDAWIEAWSQDVEPAAVRQHVDDILIVGAAYQIVSYDGIVRALEPATRYTMSDGAKHFLERLEQRLPQT